jgi:transcriptional regulator with XRE-family HTH domain
MVDISKFRLLLQDINILRLSRQTGISHQALYRIKRGVSEPRMKTLRKIEAYLKTRGVRFDG